MDESAIGTTGFLEAVRHRLESKAFVSVTDVPIPVGLLEEPPPGVGAPFLDRMGRGFPLAARRTRFELTKFGMAEYFFVFAEFPQISVMEYALFAGLARVYASRAKTVPLPAGVFETVICFSVAIVPRADPALAEHLRLANPMPLAEVALEAAIIDLPDDLWLPVVYETETGRALMYEKTPIWGSAYFGGLRRMAGEMLTLG